MHEPAKLTSPHHTTVYNLQVSKCAKSLSLRVNFELNPAFNSNDPPCEQGNKGNQLNLLDI